MPAPGSYADWDTNGTNTTPIVAGHATDGFVNNEIPTARELNEWMMLVGQWIRWVAVGRVINMSAGDFVLGHASGGTPTFDGQSWTGGTSANWYVTAPLDLAVGQKLTDVTFYYKNGAGFALILEILKRPINSSTAADVVVATHTDSVAGTDTSYTFAGVNETIVDGYAYRLMFNSGYGGDYLMGARITANV